MIKAIIFDVDGVLLDTVPYHFHAWEKMFGEEGISFTFDDYLARVNGLPRDAGIKNILGDRTKEQLAELATRKQSYFLESVAKDPPLPLPGVVILLQQLQDQNLLLAAASSSKNAPFLLQSAGLSPFLTVNIGGNDFTHPKPHPDIFLTAAKRLNVAPLEAIVFEDAYLGIQAAKAGGMKTVGVLSSHDPELLRLADITIRSMKDLRTIIPFIQSF